jgi:hypothetical protein
MSTLQEIKTAAATLPARDRSELAIWLSESDDVSELRRASLMAAIQVGLEQLRDGKVEVLDMASVKRKARAEWNRQRQS